MPKPHVEHLCVLSSGALAPLVPGLWQVCGGKDWELPPLDAVLLDRQKVGQREPWGCQDRTQPARAPAPWSGASQSKHQHWPGTVAWWVVAEGHASWFGRSPWGPGVLCAVRADTPTPVSWAGVGPAGLWRGTGRPWETAQLRCRPHWL